MSYTSALKTELVRERQGGEASQNMELAGILVSSAKLKFSRKNVDAVIKTDSAAYCRYLYKLTSDLYDLKPEILVDKDRGRRRFTLSYLNADPMLKGTKVLARDRYWFSPVFQTILDAPEKQRRAFLRGCFLGSGSISNPEKQYHLEIGGSLALAETLTELMEMFSIQAGITGHRNQYMVYLKDSEKISDFLRLIGAYKALMDYENVRIGKELRNEVNRQVNCETANLNKTATASAKEIEAIEFLKQTGNYAALPDDLKRSAELRLSYPEDSIGELASKATDGVSRSTLHRRLKRLVDLKTGLETKELETKEEKQ